MSNEVVQEQRPFDVGWRTIDELKIRYATSGTGTEKVVLFSPWPESIYAFAPVWGGLTKQFEVLALDLPGFRAVQRPAEISLRRREMGQFIARKAIDAVRVHVCLVTPLDSTSARLLVLFCRARAARALSEASSSWGPALRRIRSSRRAFSSR